MAEEWHPEGDRSRAEPFVWFKAEVAPVFLEKGCPQYYVF